MHTALRWALVLLLVPACFVAGSTAGPHLQALQRAWFPEPEFVRGDWSHLLERAGAQVVVYATSTCPYCARTRTLLEDSGVSFREYLIDQSPQAQRDFVALEGRGVPLIFVGERRISGFREPAIREALQWLASASGPSTRPATGSASPRTRSTP
jgi:mycoredoxin